jgi:hypothetical protein
LCHRLFRARPRPRRAPDWYAGGMQQRYRPRHRMGLLQRASRWEESRPEWLQGLIAYIAVVLLICGGPLIPAIIAMIVLLCLGQVHL